MVKSVFNIIVLTLAHLTIFFQIFYFSFLYSFKNDDYTGSYYNINEDIKNFDISYGSLSSVQFLGITLMSPIGGYLADTFNKKYIVVISIIGASLSSLLITFTISSFQILVLRLFLGAFSGMLNPSAYSILNETISKNRQVTILTVYNYGIYIGTSLSTLTTYLIMYFGWRNAILVIGMIGVIIGILCLGIDYNGRDAEESYLIDHPYNNNNLKKVYNIFGDIYSGIQFLVSKKVLILLFIGAASRVMGAYAIGMYIPLYYSHIYNDYNYEFHIVYIFCTLIAPISGFITSYICDKYNDDVKSTNISVCILSSLSSCILIVSALLIMDNFYSSISILFIAYVTAECWFSVALSFLASKTKCYMYGVVSSLLMMFISVTGFMGDYILGYIVNLYKMKDRPSVLGFTLAQYIGSMYIIGTISFLSVYRMNKSV